MKDAVAPVVTLTDDGCVVMIGELVEGAAGDADVPPPPQPCSAMNIKKARCTDVASVTPKNSILQMILDADDRRESRRARAATICKWKMFSGT